MVYSNRNYLTRHGMTLIEIAVFMTITSVAIAATLSVFISQRTSQRMSEERRIASMAAAQKIDEIRIYLQKGNTLDQAFQQYGPLPLPTGGPGATFKVPGLTPFYDFDPLDGDRPNARSVGTVSIIIDEKPNEALYGYDYANFATLPPFGIDINASGTGMIQTGFANLGAKGYNDDCPWPFPLDINGNGSDGKPLSPWESNVLTGYCILPVVITIQWNGVNGPQRFDMFALITPIMDSEVGR